MDDDPGYNAFDAAVRDYWAIGDDTGMVLGWHLCCEIIRPDGERRLRFAWSEGMKSYQLKGYLHHALDDQLSTEVADEVKAD